MNASVVLVQGDVGDTDLSLVALKSVVNSLWSTILVGGSKSYIADIWV